MKKGSSAAITIRTAITAGLDGIEKANWRRHQNNAAKAGIFKWLEEKQPDLELWTDLVPGHVFEFTHWLTKERCPVVAPRTASGYLNPLRLGARYIQRYYPAQWTQIFVRGCKPKIMKAPKRYLMADQVKQAMEVAKEQNDTAVLAAFYFGALAGLRLEEMVALESKDVHADGLDVTRGKNDYSYRLIPLNATSADFAKAWARCHSRFPLRSMEALSHRIRAILDDTADATKDDTFRMIDPHQAMRTTFVNLALHAGAESQYLDGYIGHSPGYVLTKDYADIVPQLTDLPRLRQAKIEQMTNRVVSPLEVKIQAAKIY